MENQNRSTLIICFFAFASFLLHFFINLSGAYGFFRDELYYIACSEHLDWGYVDHPPLSIYLLKLSRLILGDSLLAIRTIPALAIAGTLFVTGMIVREMGGSDKAIFITCFTFSFSMIHIAMGGFYNMNPIDIFIWTLAFYIIVQIKKQQNARLWLWLGLVLGLGLLNKISVLFLGAGILTALILTEERHWLATKWPYLGGLIALIIFLPYIIWNINHDLAHLEFIKNAQEGKYSGRERADFVTEALLYLNPLNFPIWLSGLFGLFFFKRLRSIRLLGWIFIVALLILFLNKTSKGEYLAPAISILFASAGIVLENLLNKKSMKVLLYCYLFMLFLVSAILTPTVLPVLPVEKYISYTKALHIPTASSEGKKMSELPQFYADMFGWEQKAKDVATVYNMLSKEEKEKCAIYASNYGRTGAIDFFGKKYGLPSAIGNHNNYWIWGPGKYTGEVMIILGGSYDDHKDDFESCQIAAQSDCKYCMPYEDNLNIYICKGLKKPLKEIWKEEKHFE
jgi:hypothetical protein